MTVLQGRFGRLFQVSDSEEFSRDPEPDFASKAVSREWSSLKFAVRLLSPQILLFQLALVVPKALPISMARDDRELSPFMADDPMLGARVDRTVCMEFAVFAAMAVAISDNVTGGKSKVSNM